VNQTLVASFFLGPICHVTGAVDTAPVAEFMASSTFPQCRLEPLVGCQVDSGKRELFGGKYGMAIFKKCPHCGQPTVDGAKQCQCGFDFEKWKNVVSILGLVGALAGPLLARAVNGSFAYALPAAIVGLGVGVVVGIVIMKAKAH
jgi:hypothetical protein